MPLREVFNKELVVLDGGMGTMLQSKGLDVSGIPELLGITNPNDVIDIHKSYINAGSDIIYANTFGVNSLKLKDTGYTLQQVVASAISNAKIACKGTNTLVALDIGPLGEMIEPSGNISFETAYELFKEKELAGKDADLIVVETMTDLYEIKAALLAAKENSNLPVFCTMSFESSLRTYTGCSISAMALTLQSLGADAIGVNCSIGPNQLLPIVSELSKWTNLPIVIKPNAGLPNGQNCYDVNADEFAKCIEGLLKYGVKFVGGCCGTTPKYIEKTKLVLENHKAVMPNVIIQNAVCTPLKTVIIDENTVIGECTKQISDTDTLIEDAFSQIDNGADIVCVNYNGINDIEYIKSSIKELQTVINIPLLIQSSSEECLNIAQRYYNGKPLIKVCRE